MEQGEREPVQEAPERKYRLSDYDQENNFPVIFARLSDMHVRRTVMLVGAVATLLPWYVHSYYFDLSSQSLASGLFAVGSMVRELAALFFMAGLFVATGKEEKWSLVGAVAMTVGLGLALVPVPDYPILGMGMLIGILVTAYAYLIGIAAARKSSGPGPEKH
jgi:hypothetical protein